MDKYHYDADKDLPLAINQLVAQKTGRIGGVTLKSVRDDDKVIRYDLPAEFPVWNIRVAPWLAELLHLDRLESVDNKCIQWYAFIKDGSDAEFVFLIDEGPFFGYECQHDEVPCFKIQRGNIPFNDAYGKQVAIPPYLEDASDDYLDHWENQQIKKVWPSHMDNIANCFWDFLQDISQRLSNEKKKKPPVEVIVEDVEPLSEAEQHMQQLVERKRVERDEAEKRLAQDFERWKREHRTCR